MRHIERKDCHGSYLHRGGGESLSKDLGPALLGNELKRLSADRNEPVYTCP